MELESSSVFRPKYKLLCFFVLVISFIALATFIFVRVYQSEDVVQSMTELAYGEKSYNGKFMSEWIELAKSKKANDRRLSARALAVLQLDLQFVALLNDEDEAVKKDALSAVVYFKKDKVRIVKALEVLLQKSTDLSEKTNLIRRLGHFEGTAKRAIPHIKEVLDDIDDEDSSDAVIELLFEVDSALFSIDGSSIDDIYK